MQSIYHIRIIKLLERINTKSYELSYKIIYKILQKNFLNSGFGYLLYLLSRCNAWVSSN